MPVTPDISRDTFPTNKPKNYSRVTIQQGKSGVDAEINEALDQQNFERRQLSDDLIVDGAISSGFLVVGTGAVNQVNIMATGSAQDGITVGRIRLNNWRLDLPVDFTSTDAGHYALTGSNYYTLTGFTTPGVDRIDLVYLEAFEEDIDSSIDSYLIDPVITTECAIRKRVKYILQIAEGTTVIPSLGAGHYGLRLATIARHASVGTIVAGDVTDVRPTCTFADSINPEVVTARGSLASLNARLSVSLKPTDGTLVDSIVDGATLQKVSNVLSVKDAGIVSAKIASGAVESTKIATGGVATANIADLAVTGAKIANATIDASKVIDNSITGTKIADASVTLGKLAPLSVDNSKLVDLAVTTPKIVDQAVTASKIASGTITDTQISSSAGIAISKVNTDTLLEVGDTKWRMCATVVAGARWLLMDGKTIGDASSGATALASPDAYNLFCFLWNNVSDTYAPVSGGRGATADADFAGHRNITIPSMTGLVAVGFNGADTNFNAIGKNGGENAHTLIVSEMPSHKHTVTQRTVNDGSVAGILVLGPDATATCDTSTVGSNGAHNNLQPYRTGYWFIRY